MKIYKERTLIKVGDINIYYHADFHVGEELPEHREERTIIEKPEELMACLDNLHLNYSETKRNVIVYRYIDEYHSMEKKSRRKTFIKCLSLLTLNIRM